ncbi:hypothetical protein ABZ135_33030 [Streptomyces sp. NPDC006339]|uniref:hypothetical protein n=1 Tax=Streptomyces sp. NPDC006339 TaxID=3156755 RepID=UPI0033B257D3
MARVTVDGDRVVVRLGPGETAAARRRTIRLPVAALRAVGVETGWWRALRGEAGRGRWMPGRCVGTRYGPAGEDFVAVRADGRPVLVLDFGRGAPFDRVALTVPDPERTARELRALMPEGPPSSGTP